MQAILDCRIRWTLALDMWLPAINHVRYIHHPRLVSYDSLHSCPIGPVSVNRENMCCTLTVGGKTTGTEWERERRQRERKGVRGEGGKNSDNYAIFPFFIGSHREYTTKKRRQCNVFLLTRSLNDEKLPFDGGLSLMITVLPLLTSTARFDGGSGAVYDTQKRERKKSANLMWI